MVVGMMGAALSLPAPVFAVNEAPSTGSGGSSSNNGGGGNTANGSTEVSPCDAGQVRLSDGRTCCPKGSAKNATTCLFAKYVNPVINLLSALVGIVVVIAIIIGGIQFSTSAGDPQKAAAGKKHIANALFGLLAYLLLYAFLQFIVPGGQFNG